MHNYKELLVWQKGRELVKFVYGLAKQFPKEEMYALTSQVTRSVVSIPSNIAEGAGHFSNKEFARFLEIGYSSSCELDTQMILAFDLEFINQKSLEEFSSKLNEIQKMIGGLIKSLAEKNKK
jgi:four helix bundle protein